MGRTTVHFPLNILVRLAWRNLWRHRRRTLITLVSIAVGFALAVLFIGLGDGSHNSMIRNAINLGDGHLTVQPRGYIEAPANYKFLRDTPAIEQAFQRTDVQAHLAPRIALQVLASTASNSVGAALEGMNMQQDPRAQLLRPFLQQGDWLQPGDTRGVLIGSGMARKLKIGVGAKIVLLAGTQSGDTQAQLGRVRGIFTSNMNELDDFLVLSGLSFAHFFLQGEGADPQGQALTRLAVFLEEADTLAEAKGALKANLENEQVQVLDWMEMMPQLVQFIALDDIGNYVFLVLILVLVVFGILNTVLMSVLERTREFGLLRALGLGRRHLILLVVCESVLLSLLAVVVGWLAGGGTHLWFSTHGIDFSSLMGSSTATMGTFMDPVVYTELSGARVVQLTAIVFSATLASGIYPAIKAARVSPVEALRT